jgi:hypothetical protein
MRTIARNLGLTLTLAVWLALLAPVFIAFVQSYVGWVRS